MTLWLQNSHAAPIPAGAVTLDRMGAETPVALARELGPFESVPVDVSSLLPDLAWPAQIELRAGRHVVRPRYEIVRNGRTRIAHMNVERADLQPDPNIPTLPASLGRGYLLPFPILPPTRFRTEIQPNPMAHSQTSLPLRLDVFAANGQLVRQRFLGNLGRCFDLAATFDEDADALGEQGGHGELVYDFRDGGQADGWMHALVRFEDRASGHLAETSFGAHIFNTVMTYRGEPQSYSGPPPGLSTRLFLKLGEAGRHSFSALIYPASSAWHPHSTTTLQLHASDGTPIAERPIAIACSGSALVFPHKHFEPALIEQAGPDGLRPDPRPDLPPVRLSRPDGRPWRLFPRSHVRLLTRHERPPSMSRFTIVAAIASLGGLLFGYDTGVISGALLFIKGVFHLSPGMQGLVVALALAGATIGAAFAGSISDRFGRRRVIIATACLFVVGSLVSAIASSVATLLIGRFIIGVAIGVASMLTPLYLSEVAPAAKRGAVVSLNQMCITIGIVASYGVDYAFSGAATDGWRWMLGLGCVPGIILGVGMAFMPDSPRWLAGVGRIKEAEAALHHLRDGTDVSAELNDLKRDVQSGKTHTPWSAILHGGARKSLIVGVGLAIFQQVTGINTVIYFAPSPSSRPRASAPPPPPSSPPPAWAWST